VIRIGQLRASHDTAEIALLEAHALCDATVGEPDLQWREVLAVRIGQLRASHVTTEIALLEAQALYNAELSRTGRYAQSEHPEIWCFASSRYT
jgi:hypothetical protein